MIKPRYLPALTLLVLGGFFPGVTQAAPEKVHDILAAQVRTQGIPCDKALRARLNKKQSRPDHDVWILTCDNATYRVSRYPDRGAKIEQLR